MRNTQEISWIELPAFRVIGLKWSGTFAEAAAGSIRDLQAEFRRRASELQGVESPDKLLGLSYDVTDQGFVHYAALQVSEVSEIPEGMEALLIPALRYAECVHQPNDEPESSYHRVYDWIAQHQAEARPVNGLTHVEIYPITQDSYADTPTFRILVPVESEK